jgi:hypothetical protein
MSRKTSLTAMHDPQWQAEFRDQIIRRGLASVVRTYGNDHLTLYRAIVAAGGDALLAERAAIQRCGRKAGAGRVVQTEQVAA